MNLENLTEEEFLQLPLVIRGESKEVRYVKKGQVVLRYLPTIYSYTHNRCAEVSGSERIRLDCTRTLIEVLRQAGIRHSYLEVTDRWVLSDLVLPHPVEFAKYKTPQFTPPDLSEAQIRALPVAPPIEVIVKSYHGGTSKHRYLGMEGARVRGNHTLFAGYTLKAGDTYPLPIVRFDWRNPLIHEGKRVADEALPEDLAHLFIDTFRAHRTARHVFAALQDYMGARDVMIYDLCLFLDTSGTLVYGEISPDCGRFRHFLLGELDKDVWRAGGSHAEVLTKWNQLAEMLRGPAKTNTPPRTVSTLCNLHSSGPMHITIGTTNPYKVREIAALLEPTGASLTPCSMDIEEPGATFAENSYIKAAAYAKATGCMALAEDSGLVIPALKGLPGVYSARISDCNVSLEEGRVLSYIPTGRLREEIDQVNNEWVLKSLADVEQPYRAAYFEVVFTLVRPNGEVVFQTTGRYDGWIAEEARGTHGFGYDPIFVGNDTDGFTLAELDPGRKNLRSHRQRALSELAIWYGREMCPQQGESP